MADEALPSWFTGEPSAVCSLLPQPLLMTGLFRSLLTSHFCTSRNIQTPDLRQLIWQETPPSGILIESKHRWRPDMTQNRPAVIIGRNAYQNQRIGIGDRHQPSPRNTEGTHYATMWLGSHSLFCIGGTGAQAELLATEVQRELTEFGEEIRKTMRLHRFAVTEVSAIHELEESTENFVVHVTVGYAFQELWLVRAQTPPLRRISLSMILDL